MSDRRVGDLVSVRIVGSDPWALDDPQPAAWWAGARLGEAVCWSLVWPTTDASIVPSADYVRDRADEWWGHVAIAALHTLAWLLRSGK